MGILYYYGISPRQGRHSCKEYQTYLIFLLFKNQNINDPFSIQDVNSVYNLKSSEDSDMWIFISFLPTEIVFSMTKCLHPES